LNCKGLARATQAASAPAYWSINTKLIEPTVAKVKTAILQHALSIALVGIHALGGVPGLPAATTPAGEPSTRSVQYCVPQDDDPNSYRFYCRRDAAKPYRSEAEAHAKDIPTSTIARQMQ
jgi:hypothetical protein